MEETVKLSFNWKERQFRESHRASTSRSDSHFPHACVGLPQRCLNWPASLESQETRQVDAYLINRYYDPMTDQFLSVDPRVAQTDQPYVFAGDSPLNATDPLGLSISGVNGESCISLSACSNPSVQARNQAIWHAASSAAFWAGVNAYLAMQRTRASAEHSSLSKYTSDAGACSNRGCDIVDPLLTYGGLVAGGAGVVLSVASAPVSVPIEVAVAAFAFGLTGAAVDGYECGRRVASACPGAAMGAVAMAAPLGGGIAMFATSFAVAGWIYDSVSTFAKQ
jgi:RHS repeat-associated protein